MEGTTSLSKGIFVYKKGKGSPKKINKKEKHTYLPWMEEPWYKAYKSSWTLIENHVKELYDNIFSQLLQDVTTFFSSDIELNPVFFEIPTALILTGINLPDHSVLYKSLESKLKEEVSPHVVLLSSRTCSKLRNLLGHVLRQCESRSMNDESLDNSLNDSADEEEITAHDKIMPCSYNDISKWYSNQYEGELIKKPIIIVLTDFELFNASVLEDFIYIASEYWKKVPIYLIFGVATTISAVHSSLTYRAMSNLNLKTFLTEKSNVLINQLISKVILSPECNLRLGGNSFELLSANFLFNDLSIQSFLEKLKYLLFMNFRTHKVPISKWTETEIKKWINNLNKREIEEIMNCQSFKKYVSELPKDKIKKILSNDKDAKNEVIFLIMHFIKKYKLFLIGMQCLNVLSSDLPGLPLGKYLGDLFVRVALEPINKSSDFKECVNFWKNLSKTGLEIHLRNVIRILNDSEDEDGVKEWLKKLTEAKKRLHNLDNKQNECPSPQKNRRVQEVINVSNRAQLKEKLKEIAGETSSDLNKYEILRKEIIETLIEMLGGETNNSLLKPPCELPLHEILLCEESTTVLKSALIGQSRTTLHKALTEPQTVLKCKCCKIDDHGDIKPCMPDICIAYKLHLECVKFINLYDWMQSFNQVIKLNKEEDKPDSDKISTEAQSRFTQSMNELQFLGYIKPSNRKVDHVARLTFGNN